MAQTDRETSHSLDLVETTEGVAHNYRFKSTSEEEEFPYVDITISSHLSGAVFKVLGPFALEKGITKIAHRRLSPGRFNMELTSSNVSEEEKIKIARELGGMIFRIHNAVES